MPDLILINDTIVAGLFRCKPSYACIGTEMFAYEKTRGLTENDKDKLALLGVGVILNTWITKKHGVPKITKEHTPTLYDLAMRAQKTNNDARSDFTPCPPYADTDSLTLNLFHHK